MKDIREVIINNKTVIKIYEYYAKAVSYINFPIKHSKTSLVVYLLAALIIFFISVNGRYQQLDAWKQDNASYFYNNTPMMTTLDAYKYIRHAKELNAGEYEPGGNDLKIFYPEGVPFYDPAPLLSVMLAKLHNILDVDYYNIAINMVPWLSSIFIFALFAYFYIAGYPASGIIAGLLTSFAPIYYHRTSIGRFDTDGGNLFFLFLAPLFILLASKAAKRSMIYIYTALLGITVLLFQHFYNHLLFNLIFFVMLIATLFIYKVKYKDILISCLIYIIVSNPFAFLDSLSSLIGSLAVYIPFLPNNMEAASPIPWVYNTISEAAGASLMEIADYTTKNIILFFTGLIFGIIFLAANIKKTLPVLPVFIMGLLAFVSSARFAIFLMPFIVAGYGYILYIISHYLMVNFGKNTKHYDLTYTFTPLVLSFFVLSLIFTQKGTEYGIIPAPSINTIIYEDIDKIGKTLPEDATIYTWWDYGLAIADITGKPVYHSGMSQSTPKTWMIAKSLTDNQQTFYNIASYIEQGGYEEVDAMFKDNKTVTEVEEKMMSFNKGPSKPHMYALFTSDMVQKYFAFSYLSQKDDAVYPAVCTDSDNPNIIVCSNKMRVDLSQGVIYTENGYSPLSAIIYTNKGIKTNSKIFSLEDKTSLIIEKSDNIYPVYVLPAKLLNNSFIQLFLTGDYNKDLFTLVYDNYPFSRLYELNVKK